MQYGVIMAGGAGTRLWPLSRGNTPKQLLPVVGGKSLLQLAYERLAGVIKPENIYVCTGEVFRDAIQKNLPQLPAANLLGEPIGRDTSNAVGFPAAVLHKMDKDAVFAVVTADHVITPVEQFQDALRTAFAVTEKDPKTLVTFGIIPTYGHIGLGYVHRGEAIAGLKSTYHVQAFKEKPEKETADRYVETGRYYWNSGMFVWRADTVLGELKAHLPNSYAGLKQIADAWGTPQQTNVLNEVYPTLPKISIDYGVMEPASQGKGDASVAVVEMDVNWLDVGSFPTLAETFPVDGHDNAIDAKKTALLDSDGNILISRDDGHLISLIGVTDMIVVHTKDATLICPKNEAQRVKDMVAKVKEQFGNDFQ